MFTPLSPNDPNAVLSARDVRALLDCLNAVHAAARPERAGVLAARLTDLLGAEAAAVDVAGVDGPPSRVATAGSPPDELPERLAAPGPLVAAYDEARTTAASPDVADAGASGRQDDGVSGAVITYRPAGDAAAAVRSVVATAGVSGTGGVVSAITLWTPRAFDDRTASVLRLIHPAAARLIAPGPPTPQGVLNTVLELMLTGLPEKEIARRLNRSAHTVHAHVKRVYRHYGVRSRPELIANHFATPARDK